MRVMDYGASDLGLGLNKLEQGFVNAVVSGEAESASQAARIAGYSVTHPAAAGARGFEVGNRPRVREAIRRALEAQGVTETWVAGRLHRYGSDESPAVRAPAVRATELAARMLGMLDAETQINVDARTALLPGLSLDPEALLRLAQRVQNGELPPP